MPRHRQLNLLQGVGLTGYLGATVVHYLTNDPTELASRNSNSNSGRQLGRRSRPTESEITEILEPKPEKDVNLVRYKSQRSVS